MIHKEPVIWNRFMETGVIDDCIDPAIKRSWERSRDYKVGFERAVRTELLSPRALRQRQEKNWQLVQLARPIMEDLHACLRGLGFMVILADSQGYILRTLIDDEFHDYAQRVSLCEGANWGEQYKGTNAIGTSLAEKSGVKVFAYEHYVRENHILACAAMPIIGIDGEILGTLDVTGEGNKGNERIFRMVKMAAQSISQEIQVLQLKKKLNISQARFEGIKELIKEGAVVVDEGGIIRDINPAAEEVLGFKAMECLGEKLDELFNVNNMWVLDSSTKETKELTVSTKKGANLIHARTRRIYGPDGDPEGILAIVNLPSRRKAKDEKSNIVRFTFDQIIGRSRYLQQVISICKRVAKNDSTVLLYGETGTGKEMLAQAIHQESSRREKPFVAINCAAIPSELVESELFGYDDGAFTGARKGGRAGKFELADGGTIFLDEIGDMPLQAQVSLLRVLQEKQFCRVGGLYPQLVDIRVIVATHRDLSEMVEKGEFRQDLFFRLHVINVNIPPLRARKDDIELLATVFLDKYKKALGRPELRFTPEVLEVLKAYQWPGNIRELENTIERLVNIVEGEEILSSDLPENLFEGIYGSDLPGRPVTLKDAEKLAIMDAIEECGGSLTAAASRLQIGRSTLYRKMKEYDIEIKNQQG